MIDEKFGSSVFIGFYNHLAIGEKWCKPFYNFIINLSFA